MSEPTHLTVHQRILLESLKSGKKQLHLGYSPLWALTASFQLLDLGFALDVGQGWIEITEAGRLALTAERID